MKTVITILVILTGVAWAIGGLLKADGRHETAYTYFLIGYALSGLAILLTIIHAILKRKRLPARRPVKSERRIKHDERRAFGISWDSDLHPLCPVCLTPLTLSTRNLIYPIDPFNNTIPPPAPIPHCMKCDKAFPLYDDEGHYLTLSDAKKRLSPQPSKESEAPIKQLPPPTPSRKLISKFNVLWDENRDPFCPVCERRIVPTQVRRIGRRLMGDLKCMTCQVAYVLKDDDGQHVTFEAAKKLLRQEELETKVEPPKPQPPLNNEPADYKPDDLAVKVLLHIYRAEYPDPVEDLPKELNVEPLEIDHRLDKLIEYHYVDTDWLAPVRGHSKYSLSAKGKEYIVANRLLAKSEPPEPSKPIRPRASEKLKTTYRLLKSFKDKLPKGELPISDRDEYHAHLDTLESELGRDLSEYRIPPNAIESTPGLPGTWGYSTFGDNTPPPPTPVKRYVRSEVIKEKLDALFKELDKPVRIVPFPSGHDILDDTKIKILLLLANETVPPYSDSLSIALQLHPVRLRSHLSLLLQHGYLTANSFNEWHEAIFRLTDKAVEFLISRDLIQ